MFNLGLIKDISNSNIDYLCGGGYYELRNVQVEERYTPAGDDGAEYLDICMLILTVESIDMIKRLKMADRRHDK